MEVVDVVGGNGSEDTTAVDVDTLLEGLPDVGLFFSTAKYQDFHNVSIKIKGILLHSQYIREMTFRARIYHTETNLTGNPLQSWELM